MTTSKKNPWDADIELNIADATTLIKQQFNLEIQSIKPLEAGWDNFPFLVNSKFVFRFPRRKVSVVLSERESLVLPFIAPKLPVAIPHPIFIGQPSSLFPFSFHGYTLIEGTPACEKQVCAPNFNAIGSMLGQFLTSLHHIALPAHLLSVVPQGSENGIRGPFQECFKRIWPRFDNICDLSLIPRHPMKTLLESSLHAKSSSTEEECLIHGDLFFPHLLLHEGQLSGVIDWGDMHIGDPAMDFGVVFQFLPPKNRTAFLNAYPPLSTDTLLRARLWGAYSSITLIWYGYHNHKPNLLEHGLKGCKNVLET